MVRLLVVSNGSNQIFGLLDNQLFKAILMVKVCVEILLHGFPCLFILINAFVIVFQLLKINIGDELFELFQRHKATLWSS